MIKHIEIIKRELNNCQSLVIAGKYSEAKPKIDLLSKLDNQDIQRICASFYYIGGDTDQAITAHEKSGTLYSLNVDRLIELASCYFAEKQYQNAISCYKAALLLDRNNTRAMIGLSQSEQKLCPKKDEITPKFLHELFQKKGFKYFFKYMADDFKNKGGIGSIPLETVHGKVPLWNGEKVDRLLILCDQGNGDVLQYLRYMKLAKKLCKHLTVASRVELNSLIALNPHLDRVITDDTYFIYSDVLANAYAITSILPHILNASYEPEPYIHIEGEKRQGFNVGVCWRGNNLNPTDHFRSASHEVLQAFEGFTDITFHSLQVGTESDLAPSWMVTHDLNSYEATARVIASLDLVITVDTSVAHLTGAMGKPVWIGLGNPSCWRWETHETNTNWYPSARLFRNKSCWQTTFNWIASELKHFA